ncbi:hypothetical protein EPUL_003037 [Erysiphe pulchra]|uniref:Endonuclease/exonuclease/phosphatase domain-containing protein n=1 Tax=Erysiphe pulchra TaxID=225359 RepID=A0A2S4PTG4_9PEZI|nr:hypothetical protein EPUL_003037 [Erysiphe pulchra]
MAPPVLTKRGPPPDPPDVGNRVSKTTSALKRTSGTTISKPRSTLHLNIALHKSNILEKKLGVEQFLIDDQADKHNKTIPIWNIYNAPTGSIGAGEDLATILSCPGTPCFVGGDFDLRHPIRDSSATSTPTNLIDWYEIKCLKLLNIIGIPKHDLGGTIDLAFCLEDSAYCEIRPDLNSTSDHKTLVTKMRWDFSNKKQAKLRYKDQNHEILVRLLGNNHRPSSILSRDDIETEARAIIETIHSSLVGACPQKRPLNHGTPWWNEDCQFALHAYRKSMWEGYGISEKFFLKNVVRHAKKAYWNSIIVDSKSLLQAYRIVQWHNAAPR